MTWPILQFLLLFIQASRHMRKKNNLLCLYYSLDDLWFVREVKGIKKITCAHQPLPANVSTVSSLARAMNTDGTDNILNSLNLCKDD